MPTSTVVPASPAPPTDPECINPECTNPHYDDAHEEGAQVTTSLHGQLTVTYQPILDVARGVAAGYQAQAHGDLPRRIDDATRRSPDLSPVTGLPLAAATTALAAFPDLPTNTFLSIPLDFRAAAGDAVRDLLTGRRDLSGIVLEIVGFSSLEPPGPLEEALGDYRDAGALIAIGGHGTAQPELTSIVRLKPAIIRLGRDWIRGIDRSEAKRSAIEVTGRLAGQLDAWVLAEGVSTSGELRALAGLEVPLAQGSFIGGAQSFWPQIEMSARTALPAMTVASDGVLRGLLQQTYTTTDAVAAAAVLPETSGFDVLVVVDEHRRPTALLEQDSPDDWITSEVLAVNIDTNLSDAVARAMARPRTTRFSPLACTDNAGRFLGILRIERLMEHLAEPPSVVA